MWNCGEHGAAHQALHLGMGKSSRVQLQCHEAVCVVGQGPAVGILSKDDIHNQFKQLRDNFRNLRKKWQLTFISNHEYEQNIVVFVWDMCWKVVEETQKSQYG